jgi:hypothetical protein
MVHVVSTNAVLVHCQSLPRSSAVGTICGAATHRRAAKASKNAEMTSARLLLDHYCPSLLFETARTIGAGEALHCDRFHNFLFVNCGSTGPEASSRRTNAPYRCGPSKTWFMTKNPASDAVRREREENWR